MTGSPYATGANMNAGSGTAYVNSIDAATSSAASTSAVAPSNPNVIYAQVQSITPNNDSGCGNAPGCQLGVWATTNGGTTWTLHGRFGRRFSLKKCGRRRVGAAAGDYPQNWYDQAIAVDPNNADRVFISTFDVWFATRTGTTFNDLTCGYSYGGSAGPVHVDQHALAFVPGSSSMLLLGNDGGVHGTTNANAAALEHVDPTWFNMDTGLNTIEFYSGDISGNFDTARRARRRAAARRTTARARSTFAGSPTGPRAVADGPRRRRLLRPHRSRSAPASSLRFWQGNNSGGSLQPLHQQLHRQRRRRGRARRAAGPATRSRSSSRSTCSTAAFRAATTARPPASPGGCGHLVAGTTRVWETITRQRRRCDGTVTWYVTNNPSTQNMTKQTLGNRSFINQVKYSPKWSERGDRRHERRQRAGSASTSAPASRRRRTGST